MSAGFFLAGLGLVAGAGVARAGEASGGEAAVTEAAAGPSAARLRVLASAAEAEWWLAQAIPAGMRLEDAPEFFEAADEVFYAPSEGLHVFVYRAATTGKWVAWVAYDAEQDGVAHSSAIELEP